MGRKRILVLDDDEHMTDLYSAALKAGGLDVVVCNSYLAARDFLRSEVPDGLLADVRLGEFNGLQVVHLFRAASPDGTAVVATGHDDATLRSEAKKLNATFLLKPVDIRELVGLFRFS